MTELQLTIADRVATVTINRPAQHNAINYAMWGAIPGLCAELEAQLCSQVHPLDAINDAVDKLAGRMAHLSPMTQRAHKHMLQSILHKPDLAQLTAAELGVLDASFDSADYAEGVRAFIEKRAPKF